MLSNSNRMITMTATIMTTTAAIVIMEIIMEIIFIISLFLRTHAQIYICVEKYKILIIMMEIKNVLVRRSHKGQYNIMREGRIERLRLPKILINGCESWINKKLGLREASIFRHPSIFTLII